MLWAEPGPLWDVGDGGLTIPLLGDRDSTGLVRVGVGGLRVPEVDLLRVIPSLLGRRGAEVRVQPRGMSQVVLWVREGWWEGV